MSPPSLTRPETRPEILELYESRFRSLRKYERLIFVEDNRGRGGEVN